MKLALYQGPGVFNNPQAGFAHLREQAAKAKAQGADVLLLPEMYLSGYNLTPQDAQRHAITLDGLAPAQEIARSLNLALVFGYPEKRGGNIANSAALIGPDGALLLNYRKAHLFGPMEREIFKETGSEFPVVELNGAKIGLLICYDIEFPEAARRLALAGADIILIPTALSEPYEGVPTHIIPARAYENQVYIAYANHSGEENGLGYIGLSNICGPNGARLAMAGAGEEMLFADTDPAHHEAVRQADKFMQDRRADIYGQLAG
ncbi:MAG: carbon-nitrogen hydrolase family protein [Proteobacteria bacterium]|nr:carbon-nitrogen hydrolase family protein [Pseudomonadota bacterium]MBU6425691.1 carbon-nitrogen hydrolase family protein [Rhodospirillales bacterium]